MIDNLANRYFDAGFALDDRFHLSSSKMGLLLLAPWWAPWGVMMAGMVVHSVVCAPAKAVQ